MKRYTTKTANAYLNQYGLRVEQNKAVAATLINGQVIGWWNVYGVDEETGKQYRLITQSTLTEAMEEARWHLLEGRPNTACLLGNSSCELPTTEVDDISSVITKSQAMDLGFCFQYHTNDIQVYRPDGTSFYASDIEQALTWINDGTHLCAYAEPTYCDIVITPLMSGTVPSPTSYWSEPDAMPLTRMAKEATLLISLGYDPDEHWVDLSTGEIFTLDGDELVGNTSEQRW